MRKTMCWKIFTDANTVEKAHKVFQKVITQLEVECTLQGIESYHKGGFVCSFSSVTEVSNWPQVVFDALSMAQRIGRSWVLSGNLPEEVDAWSNASSVVGVQNIHLMLLNNA